MQHYRDVEYFMTSSFFAAKILLNLINVLLSRDIMKNSSMHSFLLKDEEKEINFLSGLVLNNAL